MASSQDLLVQQHFTAEKFDHFLPGAPHEGDFRAEALKPKSRLGAFLHDMYSYRGKGIYCTASQMITLILLLFKSRKATKAQIFHHAAQLLNFQRGYFRTQIAIKAYSNHTITEMEVYLLEERSRYEVKFPPEGHDQLRPEPSTQAKKNNDTLWPVWARGVGAEMTEEEKDPEGETRYNYDYGSLDVDWADQHDAEMDRRLEAGTGPVQCVYTLPPGMENEVFAFFYNAKFKKPNANLDTGSSDTARDYFSALPVELKTKVARLVLKFSTRLRIAATTFTNEDWTEEQWNQNLSPSEIMPYSTYRFSSLVKVPKFMVPSNAATVQGPYHYWKMEAPATMLALLAVNKEMHAIGKPVFYSENYFEIKDGIMGLLYHHFQEGSSVNGTQLAHRFLELMTCSEAHDGTPRYGPRPLEFMRNINVDMELFPNDCGDVPGQYPWHFERIMNSLITIPRLRKLVINVRMSFLDALREISPDEKTVNPFTSPEVWPGWRKLPWAASAIPVENGKDRKSAAGLKVFVPENRKVEKWLQNLIDMPDNSPAKIVHVISEDWSTEECPSVLITQGLLKAEQRWLKACKNDTVMEGEEESIEHGTDDTEEVEGVISVA
ncbi:hypothetical protein BKA58DRAFT_451959 [Alternaria rosae]|uniref:uncharacterized protein n=1 Tax=Alternaria rosae TaxID=1187941 RepID=UPI001E8DFCB6|nr:uncharacterized protein BKA58DRAFT_451959 [Alternaria rosae]KAH6877984.1 hypothetical protein BKA58DRAFT_451959 [Alternaria rosae]